MDTRIDDGGPAFPRHGFVAIGGTPVPTAEGGMSLRDWFAGQAYESSLREAETWHNYGGIVDVYARAASGAYRAADAMLRARNEVTP